MLLNQQTQSGCRIHKIAKCRKAMLLLVCETQYYYCVCLTGFGAAP